MVFTEFSVGRSVDRLGFALALETIKMSRKMKCSRDLLESLEGDYLSAEISAATSMALKIDVPATMTLAPASREALAVATLIPPSTSM